MPIVPEPDRETTVGELTEADYGKRITVTHQTVPLHRGAWCPSCMSSQVVEDSFIDDTGDSRTTVEEYSVTVLACGHAIERLTRAYRSPLQQATTPPAWSAPDPFRGE